MPSPSSFQPRSTAKAAADAASGRPNFVATKSAPIVVYALPSSVAWRSLTAETVASVSASTAGDHEKADAATKKLGVSRFHSAVPISHTACNSSLRFLAASGVRFHTNRALFLGVRGPEFVSRSRVSRFACASRARPARHSQVSDSQIREYVQRSRAGLRRRVAVRSSLKCVHARFFR